jgi:hypothetical protein
MVVVDAIFVTAADGGGARRDRMREGFRPLGKARCAASRTADGATTGSQSALSQFVCRPRCVIWIITAGTLGMNGVGKFL